MPLISYLSFTSLLLHWSLYQEIQCFPFHLGMISWFWLRKSFVFLPSMPKCHTYQHTLVEQVKAKTKGKKRDQVKEMERLLVWSLKHRVFTPGPATNLLCDFGQDPLPIWTSVSAAIKWEWEQFLPLLISLEFLRVKWKIKGDFIHSFI